MGVDSPEQNIRKVEILSNCKTEKIVLFLQEGDGYAMNGKMKKYYTHGVPEAYEMSKACDGTATALYQYRILIRKTENVHEGLGEALSWSESSGSVSW